MQEGKLPIKEVGDSVRAPVIHKQHKGFLDHWTEEISSVEAKGHGLYKVDSMLHPRKDVQLVKGVVIKPPTKTKAEKQKIDKINKVGTAQNHPAVKNLVIGK